MTSEILVKQITPIEWKDMAENAHVSVFNENWDKELERIDFALVMVLKSTNMLISYATAQIIDPTHVYLQYGGAFPSYKGSPIVYLSFREMIDSLKKIFKTITTLVENTNYAMLKFYMKENFVITGIRYFQSAVLLENSYEVAS